MFEDFVNVDANTIWNGVMQVLEQHPMVFKNGDSFPDASKISDGLPGHLQRLIGALMCTIELLVEVNSKNAGVLVGHLNSAFVSSISQRIILDLIQNYRGYFPYSYIFIRRIGRTPNAPLGLWVDELMNKDDSIEDIEIGSHQPPSSARSLGGDMVVSRTRSALSDDDEPAPQSAVGRQKWQVSDSEEGEDSDVEDVVNAAYESKSSAPKKRMTRMSSSPARRREELKDKPALRMLPVPVKGEEPIYSILLRGVIHLCCVSHSQTIARRVKRLLVAAGRRAPPARRAPQAGVERAT